MKKLLSLLLVFSLFFSEITAVSSWSVWPKSFWENWIQAPIQSISKSIDQSTVKKLFPLAALATVIGFFYWMSQQNGEEEYTEKPKKPWKPFTVGERSST